MEEQHPLQPIAPTTPAHADPAPGAQASPPAAPKAAAAVRGASAKMSYKFQRLREKLREAIRGGEFAGKLPGERALAKRFHVNAKTLSKALTDLAAEGLLDRSIGRGTYVKGTAPQAPAAGRWLVLCDPWQADGCLVARLRRANEHLHVTCDPAEVARMRPSFLNQFDAVIDMAAGTPEAVLRDLVVRNVPVVAVGREPKTYSTHAVLADVALGAGRLARDLLLAGHRRLAAVESPGSTLVVQALRQAAARFAAAGAGGGEVVVDSLSAREASSLASSPPDTSSGGTGWPGEWTSTALVCDSARTAEEVRRAVEERGAGLPGGACLAAVGCACDGAGCECGRPCSGYFVPCQQVVDAVIALLGDPPARPTTLWLAGQFVDVGTLGPAGVDEGNLRGPVVRPAEGVASPLVPMGSLRLEGVPV